MKPKFEPQKPFDDTQDRHHRRSIRLPGYDYSQAGAYYVTIVTYHRVPLFGGIRDEKMHLNDLGMIADECWRAIPEHVPSVELGAYVVMPNHVHGIVVIHNDNRTASNSTPFVGATHVCPKGYASPLPTNPPRGPAPRSLGAIVGSFKSAVTRRIGRELNATGIWQRNYYEHIIRDEKDLQRITDYIEMNPSRWDEDDENPVNIRTRP